LEKETPTNKRLQGGRRKGKRLILEFASKMQDKKMFPLNLNENKNLAWVWHLFRKFQ
jgi:hypothetical protein